MEQENSRSRRRRGKEWGMGAGLLSPDTSHRCAVSCKARQQQSRLLAYGGMCGTFTNCPKLLPGIQTRHPPKTFGTCTRTIIVTSLLTGRTQTPISLIMYAYMLTFWQSGGTVLWLKSSAGKSFALICVKSP